MATGGNNIGNSSKSGPSVARARLSTSIEPALAGTSWSSFFDSKYSWNSARLARPNSTYRINKLASTFESGSTSSAASSCSSSLQGQSPHSSILPPKTLRSSERASSAATRPLNESTQIRPKSRFGTSFNNSPSTFNGSSSSSTAATRTSQSASGALSPRQKPLSRTSYPYRTMTMNQSRAALVDIRQSLRPVKRQIVTDYKSVPRALNSLSVSTSTPLNLFTNAQIKTSSAHHQSALSPISPFAKCVSPPSMSRSSSTVTSPITTPIVMTTRPIPKSERPWRQKLANAHRLREAQAERSFGQHIQLDPYDTTSRILAARSARRTSIEHQQQTQKQQNNEHQLEKEIAALKCYVSEPGALDKNATVAKFRQRMAEGQITASLTSPIATNSTTTSYANISSSLTSSTSMFSASSLLSKMPSLSRRSTTAVTKENLQETRSDAKDRPLSLIEMPFGQKRFSIVKEATMAEIRPEEMSPKISPPEMDSSVKGMKIIKNDSSKTPKKMNKEKDAMNPGDSYTSTTSTTTHSSPTVKAKLEEKGNGKITPLLSKRKKKDGEREEPKKTTPSINEAKEISEKNPKPILEKKTKSSEEDEKGFNAIVQFKPQSMLRRKISTEKEGAKKKEPPTKTIPKWRKPLLVEKKVAHEQSPKPVPGTWERTSKERFISQNKHLIRKTASANAIHVQKIRPIERISSIRLKSSEDIQSLKNLQNAVKAKGSPTAAVLKIIKSIAKPKQRICAVAVVDKQFVNKRSLRLGVRKTFLLKSVPQKLCTQLHCKNAKNLVKTVRFNIVWKEQKKMANVTILLADWEHVASNIIREPSKKRASPLKRIQQELNKENMVGGIKGRPIIVGGKQQQQLAGTQKKIPSSTHQQQFPVGASLVTAAAGSITAAVAALSTGQSQQQKETKSQLNSQIKRQLKSLQKIPQLGEVPLILPDRSILEQFVQTKRDELDRLQEETAGILEQTQVTETPTSNLQLPTSTIESVSLPSSNRNSQMTATAMPPTINDQLLPQSLSNSFHTTVQQATANDLLTQQQQVGQPMMARLRRPQPEMIRATLSNQTLQTFEKPKSLFEEQMQRQAIHLQQKAVRQSLHEPSAGEKQTASGMRRRSAAGEHADVAQNFVNQTQKPFQSEQRYAAHIPLSGRQSTASIESSNSNTIDADQMIDQARYKHNQQRNKFKEAIDYLDHIFEDFQHEADLRQPPTKKPAPPPHQPQRVKPMVQQMELEQSSTQTEPEKGTFRAANVKSARDAFEKVAATIANETKITSSGTAKLKKQTLAPTTQFTNQQQQKSTIKKAEKFPLIMHPHQQQEETSEEVDIAETIVLPGRNTADRLDFTRNWLASGDVRTWAESSPRKGDQLLGQPKMPEDECYNSDEHSLGSCSAEVAAINAVNERKQQRQKLSKTMSMGAGGGKKKEGGSTALSHHHSLKNGTVNGNANQNQLRQKQPPIVTSVIPPPQIATLSQTTGGQGSSNTLNRPQPYRPQPQLGLLPPALSASGQMHKVPSSEQLRLRTSQERACSQDYQSMGSSVHSQEGFRPQATYLSTHSLQRLGVGSGIGGAFHSYTPTMLPTQQPQHQYPTQHGQYPNQSAAQQLHQLKGSIQSLPDSALCTAPNSSAGMPNHKTTNYSSTHNQSIDNRQQPFSTLARINMQKNKKHNSPSKIQQSLPQYSSRGRGGGNQQQTPAIPAHHSNVNNNKLNKNTQSPPLLSNEHALAIDALVAELELNTDTIQTTTEKRRSFPTMQTELALSKANQEQTEKEGSINRGNDQQQQMNRRQQNEEGGSMAAMRTKRRPLEEISEYIQKDVGGKKQNGGSTNRLPFETINQEKLSPSKVDAMARMFDKNSQDANRAKMSTNQPFCFTNGPASSKIVESPNNWATRRAATTGRINQRVGEGGGVEADNKMDNVANFSNNVQAGVNASTMLGNCQQQAEIRKEKLRQPQPPPLSHSAYSSTYQSSPQIVRGTRTGNKSTILAIERHRGDTPTVTDDDLVAEYGHSGFYENIQKNQRLLPSAGYYSGINGGDECSSISSQPCSIVLPPTISSAEKGTGAKIGQLIRKLGNIGSGGGAKPPISTASMISLNHVSNEPLGNIRSAEAIGGDGILTKSNSLSGEPWKCQILAQQNTVDTFVEEDKQQTGIRNRLKQTIFGGMVRRRVPI